MTDSVSRTMALAEDNSNRKFVFNYSGSSYSAGEAVPKQDAASPPSLQLAPHATLSEGTYIAICLDLDAPYKSAPILSPILHWIQPGLQVSSSGEMASTEAELVDWYPAEPPVGAAAHRYLMILYSQPRGFDEATKKLDITKPYALWKRVRWNLEKLEKDMALGEVVAANWFTV